MRAWVSGFLTVLLLLLSAHQARADIASLTLVVAVRDQTGAPIPFADIVFVDLSLITHHQANAQGIYTVTGPGGNGMPINICADDPATSGDPSTCDSGVILPSSGTFTVILEIDRTPPTAATGGRSSGWITGTVILATGHTPVAGVRVALANTPLTTTTAPDGTYQFAAVSTTDGQGSGPTYTVVVTPPPGYVVVGPSSQPVTVQANQGVTASFVLQPAFVPFWVESFAPRVTEWSGADARAVAFGTRPQWSHFLVVAPQQGPRLEVLDPLTNGYAWVDAAGVGPSGPPAL